ncbi:hypothetical protein Droror1_Dr00028309 [Drosera rotundifolia]
MEKLRVWIWGFLFRVYCSRGIRIPDLARAAKMVDNGFRKVEGFKLKGFIGCVCEVKRGEEPVKLARADVDEEWFLVMILMVTAAGLHGSRASRLPVMVAAWEGAVCGVSSAMNEPAYR